MENNSIYSRYWDSNLKFWSVRSIKIVCAFCLPLILEICQVVWSNTRWLRLGNMGETFQDWICLIRLAGLLWGGDRPGFSETSWLPLGHNKCGIQSQSGVVSHRGANCRIFGKQAPSWNSIWQTLFKLETYRVDFKLWYHNSIFFKLEQTYDEVVACGSISFQSKTVWGRYWSVNKKKVYLK